MQDSVPKDVNSTHTTVPMIQEVPKEVSIKNKITGVDEVTTEMVPVVKQVTVPKGSPGAAPAAPAAATAGASLV